MSAPHISTNTFLESLATASQWGEVRIPDDEVPNFFDWAVTLRSDPAIQPSYDSMMASLRTEEATVKRDLLSWKWAERPGRDLAIEAETLFAIDRGVTLFLPAAYRGWPEPVRHQLFIDWLFVRSIKER